MNYSFMYIYTNLKIDFNEYFTNILLNRLILPLRKTTKYQNTLFFNSIKYYNDIIHMVILLKGIKYKV